jgi:hypothetical protein
LSVILPLIIGEKSLSVDWTLARKNGESKIQNWRMSARPPEAALELDEKSIQRFDESRKSLVKTTLNSMCYASTPIIP